MSIKLGNQFFRSGLLFEALEEYRKINPSSPLYPQAQFNISRIEGVINQEKTNSPVENGASTNGPLLSIVMPVFNVGPYLDACLISVLSQDFNDFELIIVDDASTDNGKNIIDMYAALDSRIKSVRLEYNTLGGAGIPSNIGLRHAKGKYLAYVDSDDWLAPGVFSELVSIAQEYDAELVIGDFCTFQEDSRSVSKAYDKDVWKNIPTKKIISASTHPDLFRLSPVPWRKLYKREFLVKNDIRYPEGDYFYEDNPLHWFVLSKATRVVLADRVISYHRMARVGQTMTSSSYKLSAMCSHLGTIAGFLHSNGLSANQTIIDEFYDFCYRTGWVSANQEDPSVKGMIEKRLAQVVSRHSKVIPPLNVRQNFRKRFEQYNTAYPDLDLTVVIPVFNCQDLVIETLESVYKMKNIRFNVLLIDDGSTDNTLALCKDFARKNKNCHVFQQGNKGAGRARNSLIPLCTGKYTFFLDADDTIDASALENAVREASTSGSDLYFLKYRINFHEERRTREMFDADKKLWEKLKEARANTELRAIAAGLINYPWNRIISTDLLHDENIFFGPTVVHNDIPFHWHSIVAAKKIGYSDLNVCTHRKFETRAQITNINDRRRLMVFEALRVTQDCITQYSTFSSVSHTWEAFAAHVIGWAKSRVTKEFEEVYREKELSFMRSVSKIAKEEAANV